MLLTQLFFSAFFYCIFAKAAKYEYADDFENDLIGEEFEEEGEKNYGYYGERCPPQPANCVCPFPNQSLIFRSSSDPPYCQRIYFPCFNKIQCPSGYQGACASVNAVFLAQCPRNRPQQCPSGFRLVRGTQGKLNCIKFVTPLNFSSSCQQNEYATCLRIRSPSCPQPICPPACPRPFYYGQGEEDIYIATANGNVEVIELN